MTKPSYRMLKWTFFAAMAASLGTACVVSSGDGDDTDIEDGGSSGNSTAGKSGGGSGGKGGTGGGGSTSGGTGGSSAGTTSEGGEPNGGSPPAYMAGLCEDELGTMTPSELPSCEPADKDMMNACLTCMKASCCEEWQLCYGTEPTTACGWGPSASDDLGQFDCIQECFTSTYDGVQDEADLLIECEGMCLNQCAGKDDFATTGTNELVSCTRASCLEECYPFVE